MVPERLVGYGRRQQVVARDVVFDTAVADLTGQLSDPVDVLFGTQLGGGDVAAWAHRADHARARRSRRPAGPRAFRKTLWTQAAHGWISKSAPRRGPDRP